MAGLVGDAKALFQRWLHAFDVFQRERPAVAFPFAVAKKFGDDNAGYLASLVAYYGFFSLFPLLLVFVTVLGFILGGQASHKLVSQVLRHIPIIGTTDVHQIHGSGLGLAAGIIFTLLAGTAVMQALQYGMNEVWEVPIADRPGALLARAQAVMMLGILGVASLVAVGLSGLVAAGGTVVPGLRLVAPIASLAVNTAVVLFAFRVLPKADLSWSDVLPGALAAGVALTVLQVVGGFYVTHVLNNAGKTYGAFATVIALLSWIYLGAQLTFYGAEINVVRVRNLWPRSLTSPPTEADERAEAEQATKQQRRAGESIKVHFRPAPGGRPRTPSAPPRAGSPG
ncbi:MAG TPA: YihY/virulence factor BrkB family protein [Actinomycetota bacterium]|nr:YihY/virulence factor BrkB family protein [Actinomycetota bacterium]